MHVLESIKQYAYSSWIFGRTKNIDIDALLIRTVMQDSCNYSTLSYWYRNYITVDERTDK